MIDWGGDGKPVILKCENQLPLGVAEKVIADIRENLSCLDNPSNLITHHVQLTDDKNGPSVHVFGVPGSNAFHCLYCETTEWVNLSDAVSHD